MPAPAAPSRAAGLHGSSNRSPRRPPLRSLLRRGRRRKRDGRLGLGDLARCRADGGRDDDLSPTAHDLRAARLANSRDRNRWSRGPRSRAHPRHRRGAGAARGPAGRPLCDRDLGGQGRGRGGGRLGLRRALGEQGQWVEVAVRLGRHSDAQVDVRLGVLDLSARADGADALALLDRGADPHAHGPEMDERDRVAVFGADRHAEPRMRQRAGERDHAACGRTHVGARERPDVHTTVLPAQVRIVLGEKASDHRAVDGPAPGTGGRCADQCCHAREQMQEHSVANFENHEPGTVTGWSAVVKSGYREGR